MLLLDVVKPRVPLTCANQGCQMKVSVEALRVAVRAFCMVFRPSSVSLRISYAREPPQRILGKAHPVVSFGSLSPAAGLPAASLFCGGASAVAGGNAAEAVRGHS